MKTVTAREFYHNSKLVDELPPGGELIVTRHGRPKFTVKRTEERPIMTREMMEARAVSCPDWPKDFDTVKFLQDLKD
jgi:antitoxin (DNA-binding transcriptional repressor) of toxin-antitoxin stability system